MRARFFWIILSVVSFVVVATSILHGEFLRREKLDLIDQQVRETATVLLGSELVQLRKIEFEKVESIISEELGENRIGKFFMIRNGAGDMLFESNSAKLLPIEEIPRSPRWTAMFVKGQYIRILNLELPRIDDRTLQVGVIIDEELVSPGYFSKANLIFTSVIMCLGLVVAWFLTNLLIRPISNLAGFVESAAANPEQKLELPPLPKDLKKLASKSENRDELIKLIIGFEALIERVNRDYRLSRFWSYQMAHELKTPMALLEMQIAECQRLGFLPDAHAKALLSEVFEVSETITSFLTWAEIENSTRQIRLHVIRASNVVADIQRRLDQSFTGRLQIQVQEDFRTRTNIQHVEQALSNLILNALIYSPSDRNVSIEISNGKIKIQDFGRGLPAEVLQRIGEPFNKGEGSSSGVRKANGLGLALVYSIARLYGWQVEINSTAQGTLFTLTFPLLMDEPGQLDHIT